MPMPSSPHFSGSDSSSEAELQAELRSLFRIDTQTYLERYGQVAEQLNADSWADNIQELYRCIHTIKGGAVTVGAEAILTLATALEDMLSALRYLDDPPPLGDRRLIEVLLEAGELVGAAPDWEADDLAGDAQSGAAQEVAPMSAQIKRLHERIREDYLQADWDDRAQLWHEFAEQGFDLVVLELEMGLERAPKTGLADERLLASAQTTLDQLSGIGRDLEMAAGWESLLERGRDLLSCCDLEVWHATWPQYLATLKRCAKSGGQLSAPALFPEQPQPDTARAAGDIAALFDEGAEPRDLDLGVSDLDIGELSVGELSVDELGADDLGIDELGLDTLIPSPLSLELDRFTPLSENATPPVGLSPVDLPQVDEPGDETEQPEEVHPLETVDLTPPQNSQSPPKTRDSDVQVPIPLERLDRCAQQLVETIQALRTSQKRYSSLRGRLLPLLALARESVQSIAQLRQVQNDYTLLSTADASAGLLSRRTSPNAPSPERYRQGYLTINRLLEHSLRLTELGAEAEQYVQQTSTSFQTLERTIQQLKATVEESRLVPFRTLTFRARAILRDLSTRYNKPARLMVEGEQLAIDAGTIRRLEPILLHLLRNAYDHGLESPELREALGKDPEGTIHLSLHRRGNRFQLCLQDDGGGIDPEAIAASARAKQLSCDSHLTPEAMLDILTHPGFSSKTSANELSGRGVGLDVVRQQVTALEGQLRLETAIDRGTAFYIDLPVPHLLVQCVVVQSDQQQFAIPVDDIALTALADQLTAVPPPPAALCTSAPSNTGAAKKQQLAVAKWVASNNPDSPPVPILDLYQHWHGLPTRTAPDTAICLRIDRPYSAPADSFPPIWLLVDDLNEQVDLPVEELPAPMVAPTGLLGVSVQGDGHLIPVLDVHVLRQQIVDPDSHAFEMGIPAAPPLPPDALDPTTTSASVTHSLTDGRTSVVRPRTDRHILVVDDAALMRRRIEASLVASGYRVTTKQDGLEAWNWLQENELPDLVISDIEMPQMDGFTLLERCRSAQYTMPFLVVSSRLSEEWSHEATRLGASDYLTKGFSSPELLQRVQSALATAPQLT